MSDPTLEELAVMVARSGVDAVTFCKMVGASMKRLGIRDPGEDRYLVKPPTRRPLLEVLFGPAR